MAYASSGSSGRISSDEMAVAGSDFIFILADHLKDQGDVILRGESEYTVNTDWMFYLNQQFPVCDRGDEFTPATFKFTKPEHKPLAFLFEIFQLIPKLRILPGRRYYAVPDTVFDLNPFRALKELRVIKVDCERLKGLQYLRSQLSRVQCRRAIPSMYYFFGGCAGDEVQMAMPWNCLEHVDCSGNSLLDMEHCLKLMRQLITLNLSDNNITAISTDIQYLMNLTELNLSYNSITSLRALQNNDISSTALSKLRVLRICHNKITSLLGAECLSGLEELDISHNDINSFDELRRICHLENLRRLWMDENPVTFQKHARSRILSFFPNWNNLELNGRVEASLEEQLLVEHYLLTGRADSPPMVASTLALLDFDMQGRAGSHSPTPLELPQLAVPPPWAKDDRCSTCGAVFTWALGTTPRHHCRLCGRSVCGKHSDNFAPLPQFGPEYFQPKRLCDACFKTLYRAVSPPPHVQNATVSAERRQSEVPASFPAPTKSTKGSSTPRRDSKAMTPSRRRARARSVEIDEPITPPHVVAIPPKTTMTTTTNEAPTNQTDPVTENNTIVSSEKDPLLMKEGDIETQKSQEKYQKDANPTAPTTTRLAATNEATSAATNEATSTVMAQYDGKLDDSTISAVAADVSLNISVGTPETPRRKKEKTKKKRKKKPKKDPSKILQEQDNFYEKVTEIFDTVGDKALSVLTEVLDDINEGSQPKTPSRSKKTSSNNTEKQGNRSTAQVDILPQNSEDEEFHNAVGRLNFNVVPPPEVTSTPKKVTSTPRKKISKPSFEADSPTNGDSLGEPRDSEWGQGDHLDDSFAVPLSPDEDEGITQEENPSDSFDGGSPSYTSWNTKPLSSLKQASSEASDLFLVDLYDRTNQKSRKFLELQGDTTVVVIDLTTGNTVDMWDLSCLMEAKEIEESHSVPTIRLLFVYGRRDQRNITFSTETREELDLVIDRLQPIAACNSLETVNEGMALNYKCLKCDTVFTFEQDRFGEARLDCPSCASTHVVEFYVPRSKDPMTPPQQTRDLTARSAQEASIDRASLGQAQSPVIGFKPETSNPEVEDKSAAFFKFMGRDQEPFDCTDVDHNRKLVLEIEYFGQDDGEKCLGGIDVHVARGEGASTEPCPGSIFISNRRVLVFVTVAFENNDEEVNGDWNMSLLGAHDWKSLTRIEVGVHRQSFELRTKEFTYSISVGDEEMTWSFLRLLASIPQNNNIMVEWIDREGLEEFSDIIVELETPPEENGISAGPMTDVEGMYTRKESLSMYERSLYLHLAILARLKQGDGALHMFIVSDTHIYLVRQDWHTTGHPSWIVMDSQNMASVSGIGYTKDRPYELSIILWSEDLDADDKAEQSKWDLIFRSENCVQAACLVLNKRWKPLFGGMDLPCEYDSLPVNS